MQLSTLFHVEDAVPGSWSGIVVSGLTADSREVAPGFLFAAMPGTTTDGARYIADAVKLGAVAVLGPGAARRHVPKGIAFVEAYNPRRALALAAARFYGMQPELEVAVTGTNGKTSVVSFVRQIWSTLGHGAASMGTVGVVGPDVEIKLQHTTPDPVMLHKVLRMLAEKHIDHVAIETSSHGLSQHRADGVQFAAGAFTNISRDHLDYHGSFEDYFEQKLRLFRELLGEGACAVINADSAEAGTVKAICDERHIRTLMVGKTAQDLKLVSFQREGMSYTIRTAFRDRTHDFILPLTGEFQISNALVAAGLAIGTGSSPDFVFRAMERLTGAKGRMDLVAYAACGAPVFVDYSHTPDALENALAALRPFVAGRLIVAFGAGGDRDPGKRPLMGDAARRFADVVIVTDDNPRSEDAAAIRAEVRKGCPDALEIGDRAAAIEAGISMLADGDVFLVAGKGHEEGQEVAGVKRPFSDHEVVLDVIGAMKREEAVHG
jgi:UDP-N-acetylmuramoyl-L-alanyl-D-glutamate--2,6-diaminopimelate ligase